MAAEELDVSHEPERDGDNAFLRWPARRSFAYPSSGSLAITPFSFVLILVP